MNYYNSNQHVLVDPVTKYTRLQHNFIYHFLVQFVLGFYVPLFRVGISSILGGNIYFYMYSNK